VLGYADRFSVQPGQTIGFMVSCERDRFQAELFRLVHGDQHSSGLGERRVRVPSGADGTHLGKRQRMAAGSYVRIPEFRTLDLDQGFTFQCWIWPTRPSKAGGQTIAATWSEREQQGFALGLDDQGRLRLELGSGADRISITQSAGVLPGRRWAFVAASLDASSGMASLYCASEERYTSRQLIADNQTLDPTRRLGNREFWLAARGFDEPGRPANVFNGKIDRPKLFERALQPPEVAALRDHTSQLPEGVAGFWDFSANIRSTSVRDVSSRALHGHTVNMPTRAVTDHTWSGEHSRWTDAPEEYSAIHFHDDDLEDLGWEPSIELTVPDGLRSGVYALQVQAEGGTDEIPFFVRPQHGTATAPVAFLVPTLTYLAYANERMYWGQGYHEKRARVTPLLTEPPDIDRYMAEHRELGLSTYDVHSDGSGVCYSSRLRPILNMRPTYRAWRLHDAPRHFAADLYLTGWLEQFQHAYDVITDEDVHRDGLELLSRYRVVLTGSHPEYVTYAMQTAVRAYLDNGGRLMYLGGNGFYWVTSIDPEHPHIIELRRGTTGTRAWESTPGEEYHSTTGELGGLWRRRGLAPQRTLGVGFAAQGWGGASGYVRLSDSFDPRAAFIFDGIGDDEIIGDFGLVLGGAAGDEIDRLDRRLGSPTHALLLATSAGRHSDYYQVTSEDVPITVPGQGGTESPLVRADMVFFETGGGGAVFSVGSINWLGSLGFNGYVNNVARITDNVLRHFLETK
jgi:N,N-dimethylformamidase beta subunit-like protein/concanavalin A-like lectin/glucanase superfamily protein